MCYIDGQKNKYSVSNFVCTYMMTSEDTPDSHFCGNHNKHGDLVTAARSGQTTIQLRDSRVSDDKKGSRIIQNARCKERMRK
jgi:hypothetical protein